MKLKRKIKNWWCSKMRKMYLRAGGQHTCLTILPFRPVQLKAELRYEMDSLGSLRMSKDSAFEALACRIGEKMISEGLVEIKEYSQASMGDPFQITFRSAIVANVYVMKPRDIDYVTPEIARSWDLFEI